MNKGIVFDMDGVMFDTEKLSMEGWITAGQKLGYNIDRNIFLETLGFSNKGLREYFINKFGVEFDFFEAVKIERNYIDEYILSNGLPIKDGLLELLYFFKCNDYKLAVATSNDREILMKYLHIANIEDYFPVKICGDMVKKAKPHPEIYEIACRELEMLPSRCYAIEDSFAGIISASAAGMKTVFIPDLVESDESIAKYIDIKLSNLFDAINYFTA